MKKLIDDNILVKDGNGRNIKYIFKYTEDFIQQIKKMLVKLNDEIKNLNKK